MKTCVQYLLLTLCLVSAFPGLATAGARQRCLNLCTQAGQVQHRKCQADYQTEMNLCSQLPTNEQRNACKRQANLVLRQCEEAARQQVKQCQAQCPMKN